MLRPCACRGSRSRLKSNHFHLVVNVPRAVPVSDEELLRRYLILFPKPTRRRSQSLEYLRAMLQRGGG